ncbi:MAG TPA: flavin reductase family protein, partial [Gaiellaceae bacterium]|nr:flavin reductase family protein [Gaiellaceae bacterium]
MARAVDPLWFRHVLGHYPTGVCVVTTMTGDGEPVGMTVGSFTSVSLDPPLIAFLPDGRSTTWPKMQPSGTFCVNVLADGQEEVCKVFSTRGIDRFAELDWKPGRCGPVLSGATAWIACTLVDEHTYGDHSLVVGQVVELEAGAPSLPLLFFRGGYGQFRPSSMAVLDAGLVSDGALETAVRREIEQLAATTGVEVTAGVLGGAGGMVAIASAGKPGETLAVRIGQPVPFAPPLGATFAAWGDGDTATAWLDGADLSEQKRKEHELSLQRVRERGFAFI